MLVDTTRRFVRKEFPDEIRENDRLQQYNPETFGKLARLGLAGIWIPRQYGGGGMDYLALGLVMEELEYVDGSIRTAASVHSGLCSTGVFQWGSEEQKERLLRPLAEGSKMGAFGLTEPDAGSGDRRNGQQHDKNAPQDHDGLALATRTRPVDGRPGGQRAASLPADTDLSDDDYTLHTTALRRFSRRAAGRSPARSRAAGSATCPRRSGTASRRASASRPGTPSCSRSRRRSAPRRS